MANAAAVNAVLKEIVRRESRSLLQYLKDSYPWTSSDQSSLVPQLQKVIEEQRRETGVLTQFLRKRRSDLPYLGSYPVDFTSINYVSLAYLLPLLVDEQKQDLARLERDLNHLDDAEARRIVERMAETKRRYLKVLGGLEQPQPAVVQV